MTALKRLISLASVFVITAGLVVSASSDEPFYGYGYGWWDDPIPSQNGYVVDKTVTGIDIGCGLLKDPADFFFSDKDELYIVDSGNSRIVVTDKNIKLKKIMDSFNYNGEVLTLKNPQGVFVDDLDNIYIADTENNRVIACDQDGEVFMLYTRPTSEVYDQNVTFEPRKVVVDIAKNVYVNVKSITQGAIMFSPEGNFSGFYGANRVQATAEVIANSFWKMIYSREQAQKMIRAVPIEFSNFDIDKEGFIYTVTEQKSATTDVLKKLNPAGKNVLSSLGYDDFIFGDFMSYYYNSKTYSSSIVDVDVDSEGVMNLLEYTTGKVFQYSKEFDLLFIFGGTGDQKGLLTSPTAVESLGDYVYVLDGRKANVTVYRRTEFGSIVHTAIDLLNRGLYEESKEPWNEVFRRDGTYYFASIGLGTAHLNDGDYKTAMDYFYFNSRYSYNLSFKNFRMQFIRDNFTLMAVLIIVVIAIIWIISKLLKKRKLKKNKDA